ELSSNTVDNIGRIWTGGQDGSVNVYDPSNNSFKVITDIQRSTETSKRVNNLFAYGNYMFISTEFCVIKFDINRLQFVDQPYIHLGSLPNPSPAYYTIVINDTVWVGTKNGIAYADIK